jgi:EmrB/QacA subfamily drug resistance transporter
MARVKAGIGEYSKMGTQADSRKIPAEVWSIAIVLILGTFMAILDTTIVNVALEPLTRDFHTKLVTIQWVITGYLLSIAVVIPLSGWMTRRVGPKPVYLVSMVVFTIGSACCGLAHSVGELIGFRVLQGLGGGVIAPVGQMILVKASGPRNLPRVMSAYGVPTILAPVFGPTVGGLLIVHAGWRSIFFVNVPIGVLAVIMGLRKLPNEGRNPGEPVDFFGLALIGAGLVGVTYGLSQVSAPGSVSLHVALPIAAGLVLMTGFVLRSLRVRFPLLDMRLYANKIFSRASVATFCLGGALTGNSVLMPLYLQSVRGENALNTGLLCAPRGLGALVGTWLSGRMMERLGTGRTAAIGVSLVLLLTCPYVPLGAHTSYLYICVVMVLQGFGIGLSIMPAQTAAYRALRPEQIPDATPQQNIVMRVGSSIGTAILVAVLSHGLDRAGASAPAQASAFGVTYGWLVSISAVALVAAIFLNILERRQPAPAALEESVDLEELQAEIG